MFKLLEKWVNEHGSANIMEKRLGLKDDEIAAMHRELSSLLSDHEDLQKKNEDLITSLNAAKQEIDRLEKALLSTSEYNIKKEPNEAQAKILENFFNDNNGYSISQLAQNFQLQESVVQYHIDCLIEYKLVQIGPALINKPRTYKITKKGRAYVVETNSI